MNKTINNLRLFLCTFSGEDNFIIKKCNNSIQFSFALIGAFVITIFIGCFASAFYFFNSLFQNNFFISFPIGLTWALLVANMYLLLLYTVAPSTLPVKENKNNKNTFLSVSMLFRIIFMSLLAIIIAQPLNVLFLSSTVETSVKKHIQEEKTNMVIVADKFLIKNEIELLADFNKIIELNCTNEERSELKIKLHPITQKINTDNLFLEKTYPIKQKLDSLKNKSWLVDKDKKTKDSLINFLTLLTNEEIESDLRFSDEIKNIKINNPKLSNDFEIYKTNLNNAINKKIENYNKLDYLLSKSNFYIKKIQLLLFENPLTWIITLVVCLIFILPIYFKYKIRSKTDFYNYKIELEKKIIIEEYIKFKKSYRKLHQQNTLEYNLKSNNKVNKYLEKLKKINLEAYNLINSDIKKEYKNETIIKYEYWLDAPFRTMRPNHKVVKNEEKAFLEFIYNLEE